MTGIIPKLLSLALVLVMLLGTLTSCGIIPEATEIDITNGESVRVALGSAIQLKLSGNGIILGEKSWSATSDVVSVTDDGLVWANTVGVCQVVVKVGDLTDSIIIIVAPKGGADFIPDPDPAPEPSRIGAMSFCGPRGWFS